MEIQRPTTTNSMSPYDLLQKSWCTNKDANSDQQTKIM